MPSYEATNYANDSNFQALPQETQTLVLKMLDLEDVISNEEAENSETEDNLIEDVMQSLRSGSHDANLKDLSLFFREHKKSYCLNLITTRLKNKGIGNN